MNQRKSSFKNKLRNYSILAGAGLAAGPTAGAQIIYHNINPDSLLNTYSATYKLDLNGDSTSDISFVEFTSSHYDFADVKLQNKYASFEGVELMTSFRLNGFPYVVSTGDKIGASDKWANYASLISNGHENYGDLAFYSRWGSHGRWGGDTGKFVGLRLRNGTQYNYGWARISVTSGGRSITIIDYAYQSIPDSSIIAGDTGGVVTGISKQQLKNVSVYSSGKNVIVKYPDANDGMVIRITDMLGKKVNEIQTTNELYEMNLTNAVAGIYFVTVRSRDAEITKKLLIQ